MFEAIKRRRMERETPSCCGRITHVSQAENVYVRKAAEILKKFCWIKKLFGRWILTEKGSGAICTEAFLWLFSHRKKFSLDVRCGGARVIRLHHSGDNGNARDRTVRQHIHIIRV